MVHLHRIIVLQRLNCSVGGKVIPPVVDAFLFGACGGKKTTTTKGKSPRQISDVCAWSGGENEVEGTAREGEARAASAIPNIVNVDYHSTVQSEWPGSV